MAEPDGLAPLGQRLGTLTLAVLLLDRLYGWGVWPSWWAYICAWVLGALYLVLTAQEVVARLSRPSTPRSQRD